MVLHGHEALILLAGLEHPSPGLILDSTVVQQ